jgi:hypothetical protein
MQAVREHLVDEEGKLIKLLTPPFNRSEKSAPFTCIITGVDSFGVRRNVKPVRPMRVALLDAFKDEIQVYQYLVYPEGNIDWNGAQASDAQMYTITFSVVKVINEKDRKSFSLFSKAGILESLGRFI